MGTRADFYDGRGEAALWLGSVAWDGYTIPDDIVGATDADAYHDAVRSFLVSRDDGTLPERDGWPWPWADSATTDYAYTYDEDRVWYCHFDGPWHLAPVPESEPDEETAGHPWPTRGGRPQGAILGPRSGVMVFACA